VTFEETQRWLTFTRGDVQTHCNLGDGERDFPVPPGGTLLLASRTQIAIGDSIIRLPPDSVAIVGTK
jgi:hypothetical protein